MIGADAVVSGLKKLGVSHVFGIVSIHNMPMFDAINRDGAIKIVDCRHEGAATHAADGYARATGKLGVAIGSTGPGTTNAVTGLYEAQYASSPVLLVTGQAETGFYGKGQGYVHEAENQLAMLSTVTRRAETVRLASQIEGTLLALATDLTSGRPSSGALEIPIDLQYAEVEPSSVGYAAPKAPISGDLEAAAALIAGSRKRILVAGGGVIAAGASEALTQLAEKLQAPVFTTANGRGSLPEDHPLCIGNLYQSRYLQQDVSDADLTIAVGTRFQVGGGGAAAHLKPPGKLLHIDIDASVINLVHRADTMLVGDAQEVLTALAQAVNPEPSDPAFVQQVQQGTQQMRGVLRERLGPDYAALMDAMRQGLPRDALLVRDTTVPAYNFANHLLPVLAPRTFIGPSSAAIGPGLPMAVGACVATGKQTLVIHGDGGFMLHGTELATAAQYQLPLIVCVFNDGGYGVLRRLQSNQFDGRINETDLGFVNFAAFAESLGVAGHKVQSAADFSQRFTEALATQGPTLLDIDMRRLQPMQGSLLPAG